MKGSPDRPIGHRSEDALDRWPIAKTIFQLIQDTPAESTLRIGVYGTWGEGKTSVMHLVAELAASSGIPVVNFPVWSAANQSDLWSGLVDGIQRVLAPERRDRRTVAKKAVKATREKAKAAEGLPYASAVGALVGLVAPHAEIGREDCERVLRSLAESGRVVVLVDDLDRVEPALLPKLLMGLHEMFEEVGRCAFVLAVDPAIVSRGLAELNPGWETSSSFLNKIVQYPFWLPPVGDGQKARLLEIGVRDYGLQHLNSALQDLRELLPSNPRELKQFLRGLQRFTPTLNRHGVDEWSPPLMILSELFRYEFPEASPTLFQDVSFLRDFVAGNWAISGERYKQTNVSAAQIERINKVVQAAKPGGNAPAAEALVDRLVKICDAASRLGFSSENDARRHMSFDHNPPVLTLREFDGILAAHLATPAAEAVQVAVTAHSLFVGRTKDAVMGSVYRALLKRRAERIDQMMVSFDTGGVDAAKARFNELSGLLDQLIEEHCVLRNPLVPGRQELCRLLRNQHTYLLNALSEDEYKLLRTADRVRVDAACSHVKDLALGVLSEVVPSDSHSLSRDIAGWDEIREFNQHVLMTFAEWSCDSLLEKFTRPGGIAALHRVVNLNADIWLLFTAESPLHSAPWRSKLWETARAAGEIGAQNMFMFLRMLVSEFRSGDQFPPLARDRDLLWPAWEIASQVRPQPKMRSEVERLAQALRKAIDDPDAFPLPKWPDILETVEGIGEEVS